MTSIKNIPSSQLPAVELVNVQPKSSMLQELPTGVLVDILAMAGPKAASTVARLNRGHNTMIWQARGNGYLNDFPPCAVGKVFESRSEEASDVVVKGAIAQWATHAQTLAEGLTGDKTAERQSATTKQLRSGIKAVESLAKIDRQIRAIDADLAIDAHEVLAKSGGAGAGAGAVTGGVAGGLSVYSVVTTSKVCAAVFAGVGLAFCGAFICGSVGVAVGCSARHALACHQRAALRAQTQDLLPDDASPCDVAPQAVSMERA